MGSLIDRSITEFRDNILTTTGQNSFNYCERLTLLDLPNLINISLQSFERTNLTTLILRSDTMCKLSAVNALSYTPIMRKTGYIYVPASLIDSYKSATNWSTYANQFRAIEDYTVDGTITGELDETKI